MEYNTNRGKMSYREYGRTVEKLIEKVSRMEDGEQKDECSRAIIFVMAQVGGLSVKDEVAYHKLWDHLMIMSEFKLEHSWPFSPEDLQQLKDNVANPKSKPDTRLPYKDSGIKYRQYGAYLESMLNKLKDIPDGEEYDALVTLVAQQTKRSYLMWNGELSDDSIIVNQMTKISGDERIASRLEGKEITVPQGTLPIEVTAKKKRKKKK